jgi:alpha-tubulin suppressor-like RCC1 family protein
VKSGRWGVLAVAAAIVSTLPAVPAVAAAAPATTTAAAPAGSTYTPVVPTRLMDTRTTGKIPARTGYGVPLQQGQVPADATAVVLNLTGLDATVATYLTVSPSSSPPPSVSSVNLAPGEIRANSVIVPIDGGLELWAGPGAADAVVDLEGYYSPSAGSGYTSLSPQRALDTRNGTGGVTGKLQPGQTVSLDLSSRLPAGATTAVFNLTAVEPTDSTFVTAWPSDAARPVASNLNAAPGQITPNLVTVKVGPDRKVNLYNKNGRVDLIADLAGYYAPQSGQAFYPLSPIRLLDTRDASGKPLTPFGPKATRQQGLGGWLPANAGAAVLNMTGTNATAGTYVTAWPTGQSLPVASNLNLVAGQTAANLGVVAIGTNRSVSLFNLNGQVDVIVDLFGYFATPPSACTADCVTAWGTNVYGELGNGTTSYAPRAPGGVSGLSGVTALAAEYNTAYALKSDGTVWAWGINGAGQLGNGTSGGAVVPGLYSGEPFRSPVPVQVQGLSDITAIAQGFALRADGTVWSWGPNYMWRLGNGNTDEHAIATTPVQVTGLTGVVAIAGDLGNGFALKADGSVWSWGQNVQGELGIGTSGNTTDCSENEGISPDGPNCASAVPVRVPGLSGVTRIGMRKAVTADGKVWRWGPRGLTLVQDNAPVVLPGLTDVTEFATTYSTDYALRADGTVWAWGDSYNGRLGNGTTCPGGQTCYTDTPVQVSGLSATSIAAGVTAEYALKSDGTIWAWGGGQDGELGTGNRSDFSTVPVQLAGITGATAVGDYGYAVVSRP